MDTRYRGGIGMYIRQQSTSFLSTVRDLSLKPACKYLRTVRSIVEIEIDVYGLWD